MARSPDDRWELMEIWKDMERIRKERKRKSYDSRQLKEVVLGRTETREQGIRREREQAERRLT